jgi:hypothetical protein
VAFLKYLSISYLFKNIRRIIVYKAHWWFIMSLVKQHVREGKIVGWNWIQSYGIARENETGNEVFIQWEICVPKTNYAKGFLDDNGSEIHVRGEGNVWFDMFEPVWWLSTDRDNPNVCSKVSHLDGGLLTVEEAKAALFELKKPPAAVAIVDIDDEIEREQGGGYASSTDSEDINPTTTPLKRPQRRVGVPPSPGDVLTPVSTPVRGGQSETDDEDVKPAKKSPHVAEIPETPDKT